MLEQSEIAKAATTTTITIRKAFIIFFLITGVIFAFSQLFSETKPKKIERARKENTAFREDRDKTRDEILILLENHINKLEASSEFSEEASRLLNIYHKKSVNSDLAYSNLNKVKESHKVFGFRHLNAFLGSLGLPVFIFSLSIVFYVIQVFFKRIDYIELAALIKLISVTSLIVSLTYLYWVFNPREEIDQAIYITALLVASYITYRMIVWILNKSFFNNPNLANYEKFRKALVKLFDYVIIEINDEFIKEDQKVDFIKSYDNEINKIGKIIE